MEKKTKKLVADSIAFLKNCPLQEYALEVYSTHSVIGEIKDLATRERLQVLPYELKLKEPSVDAIKFVTEFSKKTGDFSVLSTVDIQVIALTYQLALEDGMGDKLKKEPVVNKTVQVGNGGQKASTGGEVLPGFHVSKGSETTQEEGEENAADNDTKSPETVSESLEKVNLQDQPEREQVNTETSTIPDEENIDHGDDFGSDDESEEETDSDEEGWITPSNLKEAKNAMRERMLKPEDEVNEEVLVVCLTADFAMQNVLKQIGLHIISPDGRVIRNVRTYILRCYACFKTTSDMSKTFCPACGHKTLKRVAASLNEDGTMQIYLSSRKVLTGRGKRFPLPMPKGGKYAKNPVLFENQKEAQKRATKLARQKNNPLDDDYIAGNSPFVIRDIYSKAAILGRQGKEKQEYWEKKNPNEVAHKGGRRRRK